MNTFKTWQKLHHKFQPFGERMDAYMTSEKQFEVYMAKMEDCNVQHLHRKMQTLSYWFIEGIANNVIHINKDNNVMV